MDYQHLIDLMAKWGGVIASVVFVARIIVKLTPTQADDNWVQFIVDLLSHIGLQLPATTDKITKVEPPPSQPPQGMGSTEIVNRPPPSQTKP